MADVNKARRTSCKVEFDGTDITADIMPYLKSITYVDCEEDESDSLTIELQDRDAVWLTEWLESLVSAAMSSNTIKAWIYRENWNTDGKTEELYCGLFLLDSIQVTDPPLCLSLKCVSLSNGNTVKYEEKSREWVGYTLSGIAADIAANGEMDLSYLADDISLARKEQYSETDISFLQKLCHDNGLSMKVTDNTLVIFSKEQFEALDAIDTFKRGSGTYTSCRLNIGESDTDYASCEVSYTNNSGSVSTGVATTGGSGKTLKINSAVSSASEAATVAGAALKLYGSLERSASFTLPGNPNMVAGNNITLEGFGFFDAKYAIKTATHSLGAGGYTTTVNLRLIT